MNKRVSVSIQVIWGGLLAGLVLFLALCNLEYFPPTWYDEGVHLLVAKRLALEGQYLFGPALGPTVFFPVAIAFKVAGVELLSARVVMVGYLLLCVGVFYVLTRSLGGWKVATVATLLLISSPGVNILRWGRQVIGEVPSTMFFLLATLLWFQLLGESHPRRKWGRLVLIGVLLGLVIITKNQFLLLLPAWGLVWILDRFYHRQLDLSDLILPTICALISVAVWYVVQRLVFPVGKQLTTQNVQEWSGALSRGLLTFSPRRMRDAIKFLTDKDAFYGWVLPGGVYAAFLSVRRSKEGVRWAYLTTVLSAWLGWFTFFSVGWPRYAFLPLTISAICVAQLFHDLTEGYHLPWRRLREALRAGKWDGALAGKIALMALLLIVIGRSLQGRIGEVLSKDDTPQQMAAYIVEHLPQGAKLETYDPEVCFLSGYPCHLPDSRIMDAAIKYVWYSAPPPSEFYDFEDYGAPYLLIGDFGRWIHLYDEQQVARDCQLIASIGTYELYEVRQNQ